MTDRTLHVEKDGMIPMATSPTLREIGRHVSDRNDLGPLDSPATLAVCVLAREYIERHSEDFEEARTNRREWQYRGDTDADPLPYKRLQYVDVPEEDEGEDDEGESPDEEEDANDEEDADDTTAKGDTPEEDTDTAETPDEEGDDGPETNSEGYVTEGKMTFTLGEETPDW